MKRAAVVVLLAVLAAACSRDREPPPGPADELVELARSGDAAVYKVSYRYEIAGNTQSNVEGSSFQIVSRPPDSVHRIETTTKPPTGKALTVARSIVRLGDETYACTEYGETSCIAAGGPSGPFGYERIDRAVALSRSEDAFTDVDEAGPARIAGARARCFTASGHHATPAPAQSPQPRYQPTRTTYELCYSGDGVMLRMRETALGPVPSGLERAEYLLEATAFTREVDDADLELPGPVRTPPPPE